MNEDGYTYDFHICILGKFIDEELSNMNKEWIKRYWDISCPGGGKIKHYNFPDDKRILIFGKYKQTYHKTAKEIISKDYWGYRFKLSLKLSLY